MVNRVNKSATAAPAGLLDSLALTLAALVLYGWRLGQLPLRDWDEGTIAMVARSMVDSGDWLYPMLYGSPYLNKPPLVEWLLAMGYSLGGISAGSSRFLPAMVSALSVPLLYWIGRELFGQRRPALVGAGVWLTLLPVVRHGRLAMRDGVMITLFLGLLLLVLGARRRRWVALGIGPVFGLMVLTKGILALLLGAISLTFWLINQRGRYRLWLTNSYLWLGLDLGLLPPLLWYGAQLDRYGQLYWQGHFMAQSFERVVSTVENNQGPPWYYLLELLKYGWPWLLFWPGGLLLAWRQRRQPWGQLVLVGTGLYLATISVMATKLPWYLMPLYPFVALAVGGYLGQKMPARFLAVPLGVVAIAALGAGLYLGLADNLPTLVAIALLLAAACGGGAWRLWQQRASIFVLTAGLYGALLLFVGSDFWLWELNEAYPVRPVADLIRQHVPAEASLVTTFAYGRPSLDFYCRCRVVTEALDTVVERWDDLEKASTYLLIEPHHLNRLPAYRQLGQTEDMVLVTPSPFEN